MKKKAEMKQIPKTNETQSRNKKLSNPALVTGASSGIGEAYARRLAREGVDLILVARRSRLIESLADELQSAHAVNVEALTTDLATEEGIASIEDKISDGPPLSWLISSAGFGTRGRFVDVQKMKIIHMNRLHVEANARLVKASLPGMLENRFGHIVMVSSLSAFLTTAEYVNYSATKAYVNMFALGLRDELTSTGVKVQALCPGLTKTEFFATEEFENFKYDSMPSWVWMTTHQVVEESIRSLNKRRNPPIFIPGLKNKAFTTILSSPLLGALARAGLARIGRNRNLF